MKNTQFEVNKISEDENGRFLLVNGTKDDKNVTLCNIYAPSGPQKFKERKQFFENLKDSISEFQPVNSKLILGGDFNCVTDVDLDRSRTVSKTDSSVNKLRNILNNFELKDFWIQHNPDKKGYTFYSNVGTGSRLDKFYLTKDLTSNVIESDIQNFAHSDRDKVTIKLDLSEIERGPGLWKINNSYLHDPDYVKEITRMWYLHQYNKTENDNLNGWWEEGKTRIKEISINFSKRKNRENKNYKFNLRKQFRNIKNKLDRDPSNASSKYLCNKINQEIRQVEILEAEGAKIRSEAQWREDFQRFLLFGEKTRSREIHEECSTRQRWAYCDRNQGYTGTNQTVLCRLI